MIYCLIVVALLLFIAWLLGGHRGARRLGVLGIFVVIFLLGASCWFLTEVLGS